MNRLVSEQYFSSVNHFKHMYAHYQRNHDLISVGAYVSGSDPLLDEGIAMFPRMESFLKQGMFERVDYATGVETFTHIFDK